MPVRIPLKWKENVKAQKGRSSGKGERAAQRKSYGQGTGKSERKIKKSKLISLVGKSAHRDREGKQDRVERMLSSFEDRLI